LLRDNRTFYSRPYSKNIFFANDNCKNIFHYFKTNRHLKKKYFIIFFIVILTTKNPSANNGAPTRSIPAQWMPKPCDNISAIKPLVLQFAQQPLSASEQG
jgi:hypothetical protein